MHSQTHYFNRLSRLNLIAYTLLFAIMFGGCGNSRPSLTRDELTQKYPNEKYIEIDSISLHYRQEGLVLRPGGFEG